MTGSDGADGATSRGDSAAATVASAARNNAEWCAAVCRTHGLPQRLDDTAWWSARRTPPYYPDAVTLRPGTRPEEILPLIDTVSPGCCVKDSFATLDLTAHGFTPLLHGRWFHRPAASPNPPPGNGSWPGVHARALRDPDRIAAWISAWHGESGESGGGRAPERGAPDVFRPALLLDPAVRVLAVHHHDERTGDGLGAGLLGGAVLNLGSGLVGITNVFTSVRSASATPLVWSAVVRAAAAHFPGVPLAGYAAGTEPAAGPPLPVGFRPLGRLRVWLRTGA